MDCHSGFSSFYEMTACSVVTCMLLYLSVFAACRQTERTGACISGLAAALSAVQLFHEHLEPICLISC